MLRAIAGIERLDAGTVHLDGRNLANTRAADRGITMVFQDAALFPHLRVRDNIAVGCPGRLRGAARRHHERISSTAQLLRIGELLERFPHQLSGGQRQRVGLARALVGDPALVLFDEPLSNLDAELRTELRREFRRLHVDGTVADGIFVTHDQTEATAIADRVAVMRDGRILQTGTPTEILESPLDLFVATFVGVPRVNVVTVPQKNAVLCVRPTDVSLDSVAGSVEVPVDILAAEPFAGSWLASTRAPSGIELDIVVPWDGGRRPDPQATVHVDPGRTHVFDPETGAPVRSSIEEVVDMMRTSLCASR